MTEAQHGGDPAATTASPHDFGQHSTHLPLIETEVKPAGTAPVHAIVVPTARPADKLDTAIELAGELGAHLLVLCSRLVTAAEAHARAGGRVALTAIDVRPEHAPFGLRTSTRLAGTPFDRNSDTSLKRNLALSIGYMAGWTNVLLMDDDVTDLGADEVAAAASLLDRFDAVGLENTGYADNSVVCHANRDTLGTQDSFVGAGGLLINLRRVRSFFPDIYNEDWLFLLGRRRLVPVAMSGTCRQRTFDPYADPDRARQEEFGDCLAEGLFSLLDNGRAIGWAHRWYWRRFLRRRGQLIDRIAARLTLAAPADAPRIAAALAESRRTLALITPGDCVRWLADWREDRREWRRHLSGLPRGLTVEEAVRELHLSA